MYEVVVTGKFVATHQLRDAAGIWETLHPHEWHVRATYAGPRLDAQGLLVDFVTLRRRLDDILAALAGGSLNEHPAFRDRNPSAEHVVRHIAEALLQTSEAGARLVVVEVEEEPGCLARYLPEAPAD